MTDAELAEEAARWTGKIQPLEGLMTRAEFKDWLVRALHESFAQERYRMPLTMPDLRIRAMEPLEVRREVLVDDVMEEEDGFNVVWVKVTL